MKFGETKKESERLSFFVSLFLFLLVKVLSFESPSLSHYDKEKTLFKSYKKIDKFLNNIAN